MKNTILSIDIALLLERSTMGQLTSNTNVFFGNDRKRKSGQVQISKLQYIPAVNDGILTVKAKTRSSNNEYDTSIQFEGVRFVKPGTMHSVPLEVADQELAIMPLKNMGNHVHVHCTCMDFYWRFAMHNNKNDSLIGEPPAPYVKKTDRQPLNPDKVPGNCKHLQALVDHVRADRLFK